MTAATNWLDRKLPLLPYVMLDAKLSKLRP